MLRHDERIETHHAMRESYSYYDEQDDITMPNNVQSSYPGKEKQNWYMRGVAMLTDARARWLTCAGLVVGIALLYVCAGGFPPWAWRFLAQVVPQLSTLIASQGGTALLAFCGLLLLSFSLLVLYAVALYGTVTLLHATWHAYRIHQLQRLYEQDVEILADAERARLYEQEVQQQEQEAQEQEWQLERESWEHTARLRAQASGTLRALPSTQTTHNDEQDNELEHDDDAYEFDEYEEQEEHEGDEEYIATSAPPVALQTQTHEEPLFSLDTPLAETPLPLDLAGRMVSYAIVSGTDSGIVRKKAINEDSILALQGACYTQDGPQPVALLVVADGMGGHADGQEASRLAVQVMGDVLLPLLLNTEQEPDLFLEVLKDGVHRANLAIYQRNREREHMMGTTLTAALLLGTTAHIVNAGDSRTYIYRANGELKLVTRDHSSVAQLVEAGAIAPEEVYTHPLRNQIYRCLGDTASVQVDTFEVSLDTGDTLLLCSDGLWEMVRDPDIAVILSKTHAHPTLARDELLQAALDGGGADNVSVVLAKVIG